MKLSPELLGLALLTVVTVALVKGPLLQRWETVRGLQAQLDAMDPSQPKVARDYEAGLLEARIAYAEKRLQSLEPPLPNRPMSLFELLGARSREYGCELLQWTEVSSDHWQAEIRGSTQDLTQVLHDIESALPAFNAQSIGLVFENQALQLQLLVGFAEPEVTNNQEGF